MNFEIVVKKKNFKICPMIEHEDNEKLFSALKADVMALDKLDLRLKEIILDDNYPFGRHPNNDYFHIWWDNKVIGYFGIKKIREINYITVTESYAYPKYITTTFVRPVLMFLEQVLEEENFDFMTFDVVKNHKMDTILAKLKITSFSKSYIQFKSIKL